MIKNWFQINFVFKYYLPLLLFPNQLPTAVTQPGHPVDWNKPANTWKNFTIEKYSLQTIEQLTEYLDSDEVTVGVNIGPMSHTEKEAENTGHYHPDWEEIAHVHSLTNWSPVIKITQLKSLLICVIN